MSHVNKRCASSCLKEDASLSLLHVLKEDASLSLLGIFSRGNRVLNDQDLVLSVNRECNEQGCSSPAGTVCRPINEVTNNDAQIFTT